MAVRLQDVVLPTKLTCGEAERVSHIANRAWPQHGPSRPGCPTRLPLSPLANPPAACRGPSTPVTRYPRCCVCTRLPFFILVVCYWMSSFALVLYLNWIYVNGFKSTIRSFSPSLKNEGCGGLLFILVVVFLSSKAPSEIACPSQDNMFLNSVVMFKWNTWTFLHTLIELKKYLEIKNCIGNRV